MGRKKLDSQLLKICVYAAVTAIITFGIGIALYHSGPFWGKAVAILTAVMKPIIAGVVIAYILMPLTNAIDRRLSHGREGGALASRMRGLSVFLTLLIFLGILAAVLLLLFGTVNRTFQNLNLEQIKAFLGQIEKEYSDLAEQVTALLEENGFTFEALGNRALSLVQRVTGAMKVFFFGLIFSIYFLYDGAHIASYWRKAADRLFSDRVRHAWGVLMSDADLCFSGYIRGQVIDAALVGVLVSVSLLIAQVPFAIVIGMMTAFGNLIPYMGPIFGYGTVILTAFINGNVLEHPGKLITGVIIIAIIQFVDGNIINPRLLSNQIEVHPLFVIACIIAGGALGGIFGMLLAVPVGALIKTEFERFLESRNRVIVEDIPGSREEEKN